MYHCDGAISRLIPELVEMGISLLNPIQTNAKDMDPEVLKHSFGEHLSFHGGVDISNLLPKGSEEEVEAEVRRLVQVLGEGGGYILAPAHHIQADSRVENVLSMYQVDLRYRSPAARGT
jgi:uroporphyrinogen decarboxylase